MDIKIKCSLTCFDEFQVLAYKWTQFSIISIKPAYLSGFDNIGHMFLHMYMHGYYNRDLNCTMPKRRNSPNCTQNCNLTESDWNCYRIVQNFYNWSRIATPEDETVMKMLPLLV